MRASRRKRARPLRRLRLEFLQGNRPLQRRVAGQPHDAQTALGVLPASHGHRFGVGRHNVLEMRILTDERKDVQRVAAFEDFGDPAINSRRSACSRAGRSSSRRVPCRPSACSTEAASPRRKASRSRACFMAGLEDSQEGTIEKPLAPRAIYAPARKEEGPANVENVGTWRNGSAKYVGGPRCTGERRER